MHITNYKNRSKGTGRNRNYAKRAGSIRSYNLRKSKISVNCELIEIVIATGNAKKKEELESLLKAEGVRLLSLDDFKGIPKTTEDGRTFNANAVKKALTVSKFTDKLVLADDSGLAVKALGGRPGVYSARFSGRGATDVKNIKKLLRMMKGLPAPKRAAAFRCSIAIARKGVVLAVIGGECKGVIGFTPRGIRGFGYDPVFIPRSYKRTFAELAPGTKNRISHRAKALKKARKFIAGYFAGCP